MAVYSPSGNNGDAGKPGSADTASNKDTSGKDATRLERFYVRPSLGLKLWGPFVPASDNRGGLWTLVGIQTVMGLFCIHRFRRLVNASLVDAARAGARASANASAGANSTFNTVKNIADIPTLNRFSTTHKVVVMDNVKAAGGQSGSGSSAQGKQGGRFATLRKALYLITGTALLSQSMLEFCRLKVLTYDPWYEEARTARDKKFFNDIVKFYHEDIDPSEVKVRDVASGNVMNTNIPEVRQSVALVRAQAEAQNPIIKWYGPLEFKPMSFSEYLDQMEYYLQMNELLISKKKVVKPPRGVGGDAGDARSEPVSLLSLIAHTDEEYKAIVQQNKEIRQEVREGNSAKAQPIDSNEGDDAPAPGSPALPKFPDSNAKEEQRSSPLITFPTRGVTLDPKLSGPRDVSIDDVWSLYDPWMNLGLDTSLSIKFIPTVLKPADMEETQDARVETEAQEVGADAEVPDMSPPQDEGSQKEPPAN